MANLEQRCPGISLAEIADNARFIGVNDIHFRACCADWKQVQPGDLYVAIEGAETDGHEYIPEAIARGAAAVVAERYLIADVPVCVVEDARTVYGAACQRVAGNPSADLTVIGVTGTNGKTITSHLIQSILHEAGIACGLMSSLTVHDGLRPKPALSSTPNSALVARELAEMAMHGCSHVVMEVSSSSLAQKQTAGIDFAVVAITNIRRDQMNFHGNLSNHRNLTASMLDQLTPEGFAVLNADDRTTARLLDNLSCPVLTTALRNEAEISATIIEQHRSEQTFLLHAGNEAIPVRVRIMGEHHVRNCLTAASVALGMGIDLPTVVRGIEAVESLPGRMERLECGQPFGVFVDSARTADQLAYALRALRSQYSGKIYCVFGSQDEDPSNLAWIGRVLEKHADRPIIASGSIHPHDALHYAHAMLDGFQQPVKGHIMPDRTAAIRFALEKCDTNDCLLIAGQGEKPWCGRRDEEIAQQDSEVAQQWLYQVGSHKAFTPEATNTHASYRICDYLS